MPANVKSMDVDNAAVTITLLDGTVEKYDLNNTKDKTAFQKKYGKLPQAPPAYPAPAAEKYKEAALKYEAQLRLANADRLTAKLQELQTVNYLKATALNRLSAKNYLKMQAMHLSVQQKYLAAAQQKYTISAKQQYLNRALKKLEYQNIYLQKQKPLLYLQKQKSQLKLYQLKLKSKPLLTKPVPAKTGIEDGEVQQR
jgi:hypothetical protein